MEPLDIATNLNIGREILRKGLLGWIGLRRHQGAAPAVRGRARPARRPHGGHDPARRDALRRSASGRRARSQRHARVRRAQRHPAARRADGRARLRADAGGRGTHPTDGRPGHRDRAGHAQPPAGHVGLRPDRGAQPRPQGGGPRRRPRPTTTSSSGGSPGRAPRCSSDRGSGPDGSAGRSASTSSAATPSGVGDRPALSWWLPPGSSRQAAYQVVTDDGYDSGVVESDRQSFVEVPVFDRSRRGCRARVRVLDRPGRERLERSGAARERPARRDRLVGRVDRRRRGGARRRRVSVRPTGSGRW